MDSNAYTAALVRSLVDFVVGIAWPAVALILVIMFMPQIRELLGRLIEAEAFGVKAKFDPKKAEAAVASAQAQAVAQAAALIVRPGEANQQPRQSLVQRLVDLAATDPQGAVITAYEEVVRVLKRRMAEANVPHEDRGQYYLIDVAMTRGVISPETAEAIRSLLYLQLLAAPGEARAINTAQSIAYLALCDRVIPVIETSRRP